MFVGLLTVILYGERREMTGHAIRMSTCWVTLVLLTVTAWPAVAAADTLVGRWKLLAAEDIRSDGSVARLPWGARPAGTIVVDAGSCYIQIMSTDVPSFGDGKPVGEQMKAALLSTYIAYSGPCVVDDAKGTVTLRVEAAWRPDYVGTEQVRYFRFENGRLFFGPAQGSIQAGTDRLTRRLTLERTTP